jgi:hypothetical protein
MNENIYQSTLKKKIMERMPDAIILKNDPSYIQGIPDLLILRKNKWAALEVKKNKSAKHRPNQDFYVNMMNEMSFASFIWPENEEEVLDALERSLKGNKKRRPRVSGS